MNVILEKLLSRNLADVRGAHIAGTVPVREDALNGAANAQAAARNRRIQQIEIRIKNGNYLEVGVKVAVGPFSKWFRPEFLIPSQIFWNERPAVVLTIASPQYAGLAWLLDLFATELMPPGVQIRGKQVTVDLDAVPQVAPFRSLIRYVSFLGIDTVPGVLRLSFEVRVD